MKSIPLPNAKFILAIVLLAVPLSLMAQSVNISSVQVVAPHSPMLADYANNPSKIVITTQLLGAGEIKVRLFATLKGDNGVEIKTNLSAFNSLDEITLNAATPVKVVNAMAIRNVFDLTGVDVTGTSAANLSANGLPNGNYQLCVQAYTLFIDPASGQQTIVQASDEKCSATFVISPPPVTVTIANVQTVPPYSANLSDFLNNPSKSIITINSNVTAGEYKIRLFATLKGDNAVQLKTNINAFNTLDDVVLTPTSPTRVVNGLFIQNLFEPNFVDFQGITATQLQETGLPPGNYELCVEAYRVQTDPAGGQTIVSASNSTCSNPFAVTASSASVSVVNVQIIPPYSNRLSDFLNTPSKVMITVNSNVSMSGYKVKLIATLKGDNNTVIATNATAIDNLETITLNAGPQTQVLNATAVSNLFNAEYVSLQNISYEALVNGGGLPEGVYELCITAVAAEANPQLGQQKGEALSPERCSNPMVVTDLEPPVIINPFSGSDVEAHLPQNIVFTWSIPAGAKPGLQYDFKVVEILDSMRNVNDAMQSATDPAFFERSTQSNVLLFGPGEPTLTPGNRYAYTVTALDPNNTQVFRNGGRSEVGYFTYRPSKKIPALVPPQSNPPEDKKDDEPENPIALMDAPELDCSCKKTVSDKTINNTNAKPGSEVQLGAFKLTLGNDVVEKSGKLSGSGTIPVPFLNNKLLKLRVVFADLEVNASNQAVKGTVKAKRNGNAVSVLPTADKPDVKPAPFSINDITKVGDFVKNTANNAIASVNNSINSAGWEMPFGMQTEIEGEAVTVAITDVVFTPEQAGFNACLAFDIPEGNDTHTLALGAKNVCLKDNTGLCGDAVLFLVEDLKINELNFTFVKATGNNDSQAGTYAIIDPDGFKQLHVTAEYEFSQNVIVNQKDKGPVKATFETDIKSWNNWYASVSIDSFYVAGYEEWGFNLKKPAVFDHSVTFNPDDIPKDKIEGKANHLDKTWKGFFFSDLEASLPALIKRADDKPISLSVKNFMIDKQGLTGDISADDVLAISDGDLDGWYYSLDNINVRFVNSSFIKGGLNGKLLLPTSGDPEKTHQDELDYTCTLSQPPQKDSSMVFQFVIKPKDNLHVKLWAATINLDKTSNITVSNAKNKFNAVATLNGDISIEADLSPIPKLSFKAMQFQDLKLMTKAPYIAGKVNFGFASPQKTASGFPVTISAIKPELKGSSAGVTFDLSISLTDIAALPKGTFNLGVVGDIAFKDGRPSWGNPHLEVNKIEVKGPLGPLDLNGEIDFFDKDATYGNGLRGGIEVKLSLGVTKIKIDSHVMFGQTSFNYWYVDLSYLQSIGTPIVPPVSLFGLGGGIYYNMSKAFDISPDALLNGTTNDLNRYKPQSNVIGFKASVVVGVGNGTPFHAKGELSMQFTDKFGVLMVGLDIDAAMMAELTSDVKAAPINGHGFIGYDFVQKVFDAGVGLNVNYKAITGNGFLAVNINGQNGEWYFLLGEPDKRVNVNLANLATINAYFMMGSSIPGIPDPPAAILKDFPDYKSSRDQSVYANSLNPGFGFGAGLEYGPVDLTFLMFYMHFSAIIGFDVNMRQYSVGCNGDNDLPGVNGWYANGQFYALAKFLFGINLDVWFYSGKFNIADVEAAALFNAGLMNPTWFEGWLYGHVDVLGGLISGTMHFHAMVGEKCVPASNPLGSDLPIISALKPSNAESDISIVRNPQAAFNYPVNNAFDVTSHSDKGDEVLRSIRIDLTDFTVRRTSDNVMVADLNNNKNMSMTEEMKLATLYTAEAFDPQTDYTITVTVKAFDAKTNQPLLFKGNPIVETQATTFKTGDCLHRLDENAQMMLGSYPFKNQRYLLQKEQPTGFIQLDKNYPCLINDPGYDLIAQFVSYKTPSQTSQQEVPVQQAGDRLTFTIPTLPNETVTALRIIKRRKINKQMMAQKVSLTADSKNLYVSGQGEQSNSLDAKSSVISGNSESADKAKDLELYSYYFRSSKYNTLAEKLSHGDQSVVARRDGIGNLEGYAADFNFEEGFDVYDVTETQFEAFGDKYVIYPLMHISEAAPGNSWIQNYVKNSFYANWKNAVLNSGDYSVDIRPINIRKYATGAQCLTFEPSLNPVGFLPMTAEPPLSELEITTATSKVAHQYALKFK